jgi:hypothetical protein
MPWPWLLCPRGDVGVDREGVGEGVLGMAVGTDMRNGGSAPNDDEGDGTGDDPDDSESDVICALHDHLFLAPSARSVDPGGGFTRRRWP